MFIEGLDDLNELFLDVEVTKDMPEAIVPHSVEGFRKVDEVVKQVPLVLYLFLDEDPAVEYLVHCALACSETCLFFCQQLLSLCFQSVEDHSEHNLAGMADQAYGPVVLALSEISFLG